MPHDRVVKAIGNTPDDKVWNTPAMFTLFAYSANITGKIARMRTVLYFAILETLFFS